MWANKMEAFPSFRLAVPFWGGVSLQSEDYIGFVKVSCWELVDFVLSELE
jgi:hypothetical protein